MLAAVCVVAPTSSLSLATVSVAAVALVGVVFAADVLAGIVVVAKRLIAALEVEGVLAQHFELIHPPTQKPGQSFDREQPWSAAQFGD